MNRREFLKTTAVIGVAIAVPLKLAATETFKYPLIGKPYYGVIMRNDLWETLEILRYQGNNLERVPAKNSKRIHSTTKLANDTVKIIIEKPRTPFAGMGSIAMPRKMTLRSEAIVDMETYEYVKNRNAKPGPLQIPLGADYDLVMRNREAKWSKA